MYRTSATTFGRLYALYTERVFCLIYVVWCSSNSLFGLRAKRHSFGISFSLHPVSMGLTPGDDNVTSCLVNKTVQSSFHMGPTPTRVLVKDGIMYSVCVKSATNCGIGSVEVSDNVSTCLVAFPALICESLVLGGPYGANGLM